MAKQTNCCTPTYHFNKLNKFYIFLFFSLIFSLKHIITDSLNWLQNNSLMLVVRILKSIKNICLTWWSHAQIPVNLISLPESPVLQFQEWVTVFTVSEHFLKKNNLFFLQVKFFTLLLLLVWVWWDNLSLPYSK